MGKICCCCRKDEENAAAAIKEEEKDKLKQEEAIANENLNTNTKPNTNKSTEYETIGNAGMDELSPIKDSLSQRSGQKPLRKQSTNILENIEIKQDFFLKIWIETLEISYKLCDDFGNFFKPFVEVIFDRQNKTINTMDEEKLNLSNISENADVNISYNANIPKKSVSNFLNNPKERFYYFKSSVEFNGNEENKCSSLIFSVKNENTLGHLKILPAITIGQIRIPISALLHQKDRNFDGYLTLRLKEIVEIGKLKVKVQCGDNFLNNSISLFNSDGFNQMGGFNLIRRGSELEDNSIDISFNNNMKGNLTWEHQTLNYIDIDCKIIDSFFFSDNKINEKTMHLQAANKIIEQKNLQTEYLHKVYLESLKDENYILLYEIFNQLLAINYQNDFLRLNDFLKLLSDQENENFFKIYEVFFNGYIIKNYLIILHGLQKFNKISRANHGSSSVYCIKGFPRDEVLIEGLFNIIKKIIVIVKKELLQNEYSLELRDCLIWCLNIFNELLTPSESKQEDTRKQEYTQIYIHSITIMSQRIIFLKIIESYISDSPLISSLCRLMRKATQNITYDSTSMLDRTQIHGRPKDITKQFKILMVEKYDGLFLHSLNVILHKYQHYSELHYNILIILFQVINSVEPKYLIYAANKLGLVDFKDNFSIYRGKIKRFSKLLNNLHLNILAIFSDINKNNYILAEPNEKNNVIEILKNIYVDLRCFYKETKSNKKRIEDFKLHKYNEIEIHELIVRIFCNMTKLNETLNLVGCDVALVDDMFDFIIKLSNYKKENVNFVQNLLEADKKKKNADDLKKIILSIVENTVLGIRNIVIIGEDLEFYKKFLDILQKKFAEKEIFMSMLTSLDANLKVHKINSNKLANFILEIKNSLDKFW